MRSPDHPEPHLDPRGRPSNGAPYRGPYALLSLEEVRRVRELLPVTGGTAVDESIEAKCRAALGSDPRLREPLR